MRKLIKMNSTNFFIMIFQKQQNSLIAGLRATNEMPAEQEHAEEKGKDTSVDRDSEGEVKDHETTRHRLVEEFLLGHEHSERLIRAYYCCY